MNLRLIRSMSILQYTHQKLEQDINSLAGYYTPVKEVKLEYRGREVLLVVERIVVDASCCGALRSDYGLVPGYIVNWKSQTNADGLPVTEVEPISEPGTREDIRHIIAQTESVTLIDFW